MWRGFHRVRSTRINGMGLGRIPWHECLRWAEREGLDEEETETFIDIIEKLDLEELTLEGEKAKKDGGNGEDSKTST